MLQSSIAVLHVRGASLYSAEIIDTVVSCSAGKTISAASFLTLRSDRRGLPHICCQQVNIPDYIERFRKQSRLPKLLLALHRSSCQVCHWHCAWNWICAHPAPMLIRLAGTWVETWCSSSEPRDIDGCRQQHRFLQGCKERK